LGKIKGSVAKNGSGGESLIKSEKTSTYSMFEINRGIFGGSWFSVTHPHDPKNIY
jgi:hypothetical protein